MGLKRSRARDYDEIKTTEDILHRWSRPQRNSTFVPNRRDWRYETGVYQRKDFDGSSGDKTIWDMLDEDCVSGVFGRERRRTHRGNSSMEGAGETSRHRAYEPSAVGVGMRLPKVLDTSRELSVKLYGRAANGVRSDVEEDWDQAGPIPPLQLLSTNSSIEPVLTRHTSPLSLSSVLGPPVAISRPSTTTHLNHGTEALPPFHRKWKDNTRHFCMKNVRNLLRNPEKPVDPIPVSLQWWDSAVSVDAILPPGIAISAKELNAYYPHHIRWKSIAMRLFNNSYHYTDIMKMQAFFRSSPNFPVDGGSFRDYFQQSFQGSNHTFKASDFKPKTDMNLYSDSFSSLQFVERRGYIVPTFDDLLRGLTYLPTGLDARELTQCLVWYLNSADMFNPRLELNVLHVQSLVRALRDPIRSYGVRNLDIIGLTEFREHNKFPNSRKVSIEKVTYDVEMKACECSIQTNNDETRDTRIEGKRVNRALKLHVDSDNETLTATASISVRSILQFPFLSMHGLVAEALRMGITNAQAKKAMREHSEHELQVEKVGNNSKGDLV